MKKNNLLFVGVLVLILVGGLVVVFTSNDRVEKAPIDQPNEEEMVEEISPEDRQVAMTVRSFLDNFVRSAPPEPNPNSLSVAVSLLSEGAKKGMSAEPTSGDLAKLIGVQDVPRGYEVDKINYKKNAASGVENGLAEVDVVLEYSGGDTERLFLLSKVEDSWQIDGIQPKED